mgnify:FL=1
MPVGRGRLEPYAEPLHVEPEDDLAPEGRVRRWIHRAGAHWGRLVDAAREGGATSAFGRWRDRVVCALADSIDEQRTLWGLRRAQHADLLFPSGLDAAAARDALDRSLRASQRHHGWWLVIDLLLFIASGILFFVPGPNIVAYYLGFRAFGHMQSWRGARQALSSCAWSLLPSDDLQVLATLTAVPPDARAAQVDAIAARLGLEHLPAFFERADG